MIRVRGLIKQFGGFTALSGLDMNVKAKSLNCVSSQSYRSAYSRWKHRFSAIGLSLIVIASAIISLSPEISHCTPLSVNSISGWSNGKNSAV